MSVVAKYLEQLPSGGGFVYRGQSDESWGLTSTYYRRFNLNKSAINNSNLHNSSFKTIMKL
ncbi:hypothetical protein BSPWISOXPB_4662 [uncultured Gammaproteobacteria bacterium]|nr:hypothetical protein BSPWISOXPB_4662 [uncultured Gammaproteobacteria bacterium]